MIILGIGGILSDAACALLRDGELVAAVEEKKIARRYTTGELPQQAIAASLQIARAEPGQGRLRRAGSAVWRCRRYVFALAASGAVSERTAGSGGASYGACGVCLYPSRFDEATVLTLDRGGDLRCGARWQANGNGLRLGSGAVLSGFVRRSVRPGDGAARLPAERRRTQGPVAFDCRETIVSFVYSKR